MKKKLLWILVVMLVLIAGLWITIYMFEESGRDYYYEDGVITTYKQNEDLSYMVYKNFKIADGKYVSNYKNGQTGAIESYNNGRPEGEQLFYDESGNLRLRQNYKHGKQDGEWIAYNEKGNVSSIATFKNGLLYGEYVYYDENGEVTQKTYYESGVEIEFDENGNKLEGERVQYYSNGDIAVVENYKDGKLEGERVHYHGSYKTTCIYSGGHLENCKDSMR